MALDREMFVAVMNTGLVRVCWYFINLDRVEAEEAWQEYIEGLEG